MPEIRVPLAIKACRNKIGPTLLKIFRMTASQLKSNDRLTVEHPCLLVMIKLKSDFEKGDIFSLVQ